MRRYKGRIILVVIAVIVLVGLLLPERRWMPVDGATSADWHPQTFWYEPWGTSGTHKGIDIFGETGTAVEAATGGWVVYSGTLSKGGQVVAVLGPKWRFHYYAHLDTRAVRTGEWVAAGHRLGRLGASGNAAGKPPHLHYAIVSLVPLPWLATTESQGWKRAFFLDPGRWLTDSGA
ncbi:M23 family metallopeptidase [Saccharospirillum salsuginis]|uniref:M23ase beta-sheet core domain-containing protein n=1 Tax=Saccharospirillum salsuginis TaxID=418750 RepID=A0A918N873_9GAMM|nr:M23 family metallopeptidase [Saccharospirillum salsuginis]GGX47095.1 hypothetical protein GCM10007392_12370 [Saccharospirillum salsuginis]